MQHGGATDLEETVLATADNPPIDGVPVQAFQSHAIRDGDLLAQVHEHFGREITAVKVRAGREVIGLYVRGGW